MFDSLDLALEMLAERYDLTTCELAVVELACLGIDSHAEMARSRHVERVTIKGQSKSVCAKTGRPSLSHLAIDVLLVALSLESRKRCN